MHSKEIGETLVFRAGKGEWYNRSHDKRWDMGDDAADLPPARWHVELQRTLDSDLTTHRRLVVDVAEMDWLVGPDWGFLTRLAQTLSVRGTRLTLVASERVVGAANTLKVDALMTVQGSFDDSQAQVGRGHSSNQRMKPTRE